LTRQSFDSVNTYDNLERFSQPEFVDNQLRVIQRIKVWLNRFAGSDLGPETRLLEIGLGSGEVLCYLARHFQVAGLEPSLPFLNLIRAKARERHLQVDLRQGAAEDLPFAFAGEEFDVILMQSVLEHVKDYRTALDNVFAHLRRGGIFVFNTTNKFVLIQGEYNFPPYLYSYLPDAWRFAIRRWRQGPDIMEHGIDYHQFLPWRLRRELTGLGFGRIADILELMEDGDVPDRRRNLFRFVKSNRLLAGLYRTFYAGTFFSVKNK
jgi:SAM-dependent methyltransferase